MLFLPPKTYEVVTEDVVQISFLADKKQYCRDIAQWYYHEWAKHYNVSFDAVLEDVNSKSSSTQQFPLGFVACDENNAIGAVELKLYENKKYDYEHWLGGLFVSHIYRRKGVARALITTAINHAHLLGVSQLYLQCKTHHSSLYVPFGFVQKHSLSDETCIMVNSIGYA